MHERLLRMIPLIVAMVSVTAWLSACEGEATHPRGGPAADERPDTTPAAKPEARKTRKGKEVRLEDVIPPASKRMLSGPMKGIYKFTDQHGVVHFVDSIEKVPRRYRKRATHPTGGAVTIIPSSPVDDLVRKHGLDKKKYRPSKARARGKRSGRIVLYTTSWCPACKHARSYLKSRGVGFTEKDVESSRSNLEEMLRKSGGARGVPVIDVHGTVIRGYNRGAIDRALGG
jgi:glutaredoxin